MNVSFSTGMNIFDHIAIIGKNQAKIAFYTSSLENVDNYDDFKILQEKIVESSNLLIEEGRDLYKLQEEIFQIPVSVQVKVNSCKFETEELALFDSILEYGNFGFKIANETYPIDVENPVYSFLVLNQYQIQRRLEEQLHLYMKFEKERVDRLGYMCITFPLSCFIFVLFFSFVYLLLHLSLQNTVKGLYLFPKLESLKLFEKFEGEIEKTDNESLDKINLPRYSFIKKAIFLCFLFVLISAGCSALFSVQTLDNFKIYTNGIYEFDQIVHFQSRIHEMSFLVSQDEHNNHDLLSHDYIIKNLNKTRDSLIYFYNSVRYGGVYYLSTYYSKWKVTTPPRDQLNFNIHYQDICDSTIQTNLLEELKCYSLQKQMRLLFRTINELIHPDNGTIKEDLFEKIKILGDSINNTGTLLTKIESLEMSVEKTMRKDLNNSFYISIFLIVLLLPTQILFYLLYLRKYPSRINGLLQQPKMLLLLLDDSFIMKSEILSFLKDESSRMSKIFKKEKVRRMDKFSEILKMSSKFPILIFDKRGKVSFLNKTLSLLFDYPMFKIGGNITEIFGEKDLKDIKKWMKKPIKLPFSSNISLDTDDKQISVEISRDKDMFISIFSEDAQVNSDVQVKVCKKLMNNIFPDEICKQFELSDVLIEGKLNFFEVYKCATVIFIDITNFTNMSLKMEAEELIQMLNQIFTGADKIAIKNKVEKIKTIGDCYFAISGIPQYTIDHAKNAAVFCIEFLTFLKHYNIKKGFTEDEIVSVRCGVHSGKVVCGVIGSWKYAFDAWGETINIASRMESTSIKDKIQVSQQTYELLRDDYIFIERKVTVQGVGYEKTYILERPKGSENEKSAKELDNYSKQRVEKINQETKPFKLGDFVKRERIKNNQSMMKMRIRSNRSMKLNRIKNENRNTRRYSFIS